MERMKEYGMHFSSGICRKQEISDVRTRKNKGED